MSAAPELLLTNVGRRRRLVYGLGGCVLFGTMPAWRLPARMLGFDLVGPTAWAVLPIAWFAMLLLAQAMMGVSVRHAARGTRQTDTGEAPVPDADSRDVLRARARRIYFAATVVSVALTAIIAHVAR